ncbi:hypothetical protein [Flavobacterium restrictum]|uniref:Uncharacterized protein n=1 Tax=Flavobacterium restrictum TaxID=2594428 RepID=A0A553E1V8_9FLAO|nr:hypothetical protein [Flavobacterium restrictum]TRX39027.1 hypothetical protein FNW21_10575 [Flavobacterium restrictum]
MENINFIKSTLKFSILGLFIPGFTAVALLGIQMLLSAFGIECTVSWKIIWTITTILGISLPFIFANYITNITDEKLKKVKSKFTIFNLVEYVCIQSSLGCYFSSSNTLCYVSDGQNGLELVFTAWLAIPILILLSFVFKETISYTEE